MESSLETLIDLLGRPEFHIGILAGVAAWVVTSALSPSRRGWGIALSTATVAGVNVIVSQRLGTALGIALLAVGGILLVLEARHSWEPWLVIATGAVITSMRSGLSQTLWVQIATPVLILAAGHLLSLWSEIPQRRLLGPLAFITAFGVWVTVPDTDAARVLLGASAVLAFATLPRTALSMSAGGGFPLAGTLVWIAAAGGEERHGSIVGAWACMGMLIILPLLVERARALPDWLVVTSHALVVLIAARVLGPLNAAAPVALGVLVMAGVTYLLLRAYTASNTREHA